jgi:hypothetical protein
MTPPSIPEGGFFVPVRKKRQNPGRREHYWVFVRKKGQKSGRNKAWMGLERVVEKFVENFGRICNKMENFA